MLITRILRLCAVTAIAKSTYSVCNCYCLVFGRLLTEYCIVNAGYLYLRICKYLCKRNQADSLRILVMSVCRGRSCACPPKGNHKGCPYTTPIPREASGIVCGHDFRSRLWYTIRKSWLQLHENIRADTYVGFAVTDS